MKKLIILSIGLLSLQLSAQNVELTILSNSIKMQDNYLHFRYRIKNNSDTAFVLYNTGIVDVATSEEPNDWNMYANDSGSGLSCFIYDENDIFLPRTFIGHRSYISPFEPIRYEDSIIFISYRKYTILNPGSFVEYDRRLDIEKLIMGAELEKGIYKFKLKYVFFSDYFREQYLIAKGKNEDLRNKNYILFEGEIWSDFYIFEYP